MKREDADKLIAKISKMDFDFGDYYDNTETIQEMVSNAIEEYYKEVNPEPKDYEYYVTYDVIFKVSAKSAEEAKKITWSLLNDNIPNISDIEFMSVQDVKGNYYAA